MPEIAWPEKTALEAMASIALEELGDPLSRLGRPWAESPNRPRPKRAVLRLWDEMLDEWIANLSLPLIIRDSRRREQRALSFDGREVVFSDNSPANRSFGLALAGEAPDIRARNEGNIRDSVLLAFVSKGHAGKRDLNKSGKSGLTYLTR